MKTLIISLISVITLFTAYGQSPERFNYQAVVRDPGGIILNNQTIGMRVTILQGSVSGTPVYSETFTENSNAYGLVNIQIGTGVTLDDFSTIDWSNGPYFIETALDVNGGTNYTPMGTSELISVPYALHAKTADTALNDQVDDADADATNEIQDISLSGTDLSISDGSTIDLSSIDTDTQLTEAEVDAFVANNGYLTTFTEVDGDPTNEIQDISLSGTDLSISSGSTIDLSSIDTDTQLSEAEVDTYVANNGYLTSFTEVDGDATNEIQDISLSGTDLSISSGSTIDLSGIDTDTDDQTLSLSGTDLSIADGNTVSLSRSRTIFIAPQTFNSESRDASVTLNKNTHYIPYISFPEGSSQGIWFTFPTPADWDGGTVEMRILYTSPGTTGDFSFRFWSRGFTIGESVLQYQSSPGITAPAPSVANELLEYTSNLVGIESTDEFVSVELIRRGSNAEDTAVDELHIYALELIFTD